MKWGRVYTSWCDWGLGFGILWPTVIEGYQTYFIIYSQIGPWTFEVGREDEIDELSYEAAGVLEGPDSSG